MPRRRKEIHPSVQRHPDADVMSPGLGDEDVMDQDEGPDDDGDEGEGSRAVRVDPLADIRREMDVLRRENDVLKRSIPPAQPQAVAAEEEPVDWNQMLFANPEEALRLHGEMIEKRVTNKLRSEYQQEQGTQRFWTDFYAAHPDLVDDHDLVNATLTKHLPEIANLPASEAAERVADLTRQRIMKYSKRGGEPRRTRAVVEGASAPQPRGGQAEPAQSNVSSLSGLLKARAARRRASAA